jgi:serine/threonine-protein kinase
MEAQLGPGLQVSASVTLVRQLGAGGMGSVWIAEHRTLHTEVVVKFMAPELASDPTHLARFSREAAAASQVKSPHVVQIFDHGVTSGGIPYIVMELLEGHDLSVHLRERGTLPPAELVTIIGQLAKALTRAHDRGIIHRDIKPENIFLCNTDDGDTFVKLLDFGIAKGTGSEGGALSNQTSTGALVGSPLYMSPEQIIGAKQIDLRTDLWSLGVVTYMCLTGLLPFEADNIGALALIINSMPPPIPSQVRPDLPVGFDAWFARACAREKSERFASARELADALSLALGTARPPMNSMIGDLQLDSRPPAGAKPSYHPIALSATAVPVSSSVPAPRSSPSEAPRQTRAVRLMVGVALAATVVGIVGGIGWSVSRRGPMGAATAPGAGGGGDGVAAVAASGVISPAADTATVAAAALAVPLDAGAAEVAPAAPVVSVAPAAPPSPPAASMPGAGGRTRGGKTKSPAAPPAVAAPPSTPAAAPAPASRPQPRPDDSEI